MRKWLNRAGRWRLIAAAGGTTFFLEGCDPTIRTTVEDGVITTVNSLWAAVLRALIELGQEANDQGTARVLTDVAERIFA